VCVCGEGCQLTLLLAAAEGEEEREERERKRRKRKVWRKRKVTHVIVCAVILHVPQTLQIATDSIAICCV